VVARHRLGGPDPRLGSPEPAEESRDKDVAVEVVAGVPAACEAREAAEFALDAFLKMRPIGEIEGRGIVPLDRNGVASAGNAETGQRGAQLQTFAENAIGFAPRLHVLSGLCREGRDERGEGIVGGHEGSGNLGNRVPGDCCCGPRVGISCWKTIEPSGPECDYPLKSEGFRII